MSDDAAAAAWFEHNRALELKTLRDMQTELKRAPGKLQMLTVVLKQDLWWPRREEVRAWYEKGEYAKTLEAIEKTRGTVHFQHRFWSASVVQENLREHVGNQPGRMLAPVAAGYDDALGFANRRRLVALVRETLNAPREG